MSPQTTSFANELGEYLSPILPFLRELGFFEAPVFMSSMTILSAFIFIWARSVLRRNGTFSIAVIQKWRKTYLFLHYSVCFVLTNAFAVALKTLIIEEMDYQSPVWYAWLVGPLHFYIVSVAFVYLWLVLRNRHSALDRALCVYAQIGFLGGFYAGIYRLTNEEFSLNDLTTGISGVLFLLWFGLLSLDVILRFLGRASTGTSFNQSIKLTH